MTLQELIRRFRVLAQDQVQPFLWADEDVADWLNDAQEQAAIRGRLIREDSNADVCRITLAAGTQVYTLHDAVFEIIEARLIPVSGDRPHRLYNVTRDYLDAEVPDWRDRDCPVRWLIQDDTTVRLVGTFDDGDQLALDCYRLPLEAMDRSNDKAAPEIHRAHHEHLIQWALHKAFSIPDADGYDPKRAGLAEAAFTAYFGAMPDSDLRRSTRADIPHHNQLGIPV